MSTGTNDDKRIDLLQGTLDMLILRTLLFGPAHGHTIAYAIEKGSDQVLQVEHGSLYPALHRLVSQGLLTAKEGVSENNRKAKYYSLTAAGQRELRKNADTWRRYSRAVSRVLEATA